MLLIGLSLMMFTLASSGALIRALELEGGSESVNQSELVLEKSQSQQVAGYFVVMFVYIYLGAATITVTYVIDHEHMSILSS